MPQAIACDYCLTRGCHPMSVDPLKIYWMSSFPFISTFSDRIAVSIIRALPVWQVPGILLGQLKPLLLGPQQCCEMVGADMELRKIFQDELLACSCVYGSIPFFWGGRGYQSHFLERLIVYILKK